MDAGVKLTLKVGGVAGCEYGCLCSMWVTLAASVCLLLADLASHWDLKVHNSACADACWHLRYQQLPKPRCTPHAPSPAACKGDSCPA
jgi:hypothetical protein